MRRDYRCSSCIGLGSSLGISGVLHCRELCLVEVEAVVVVVVGLGIAVITGYSCDGVASDSGSWV